MKLPNTIEAARAEELAKQRRHEMRTEARAIDDYRDREATKQYHDSKEGHKLIEGSYKRVSNQIRRDFIHMRDRGKVAQRWYPIMVEHFGAEPDFDALAEMACFCTFTAARDGVEWHECARSIVNKARRAIMANELAEKLGDSWENVKKRLSNNPNDSQRERKWRRLCLANGLRDELLTQTEGMALGFYLMGAVVEATGYVEEVESTKMVGRAGFKTNMFIHFTDKGEEKRQEILAGLEAGVGRSRPMIIMPEDWTGAFDGGNITKLYPLISGWPATRSHDFEANPEIEVMRAVNHQQSAKFAVHKRMFEFIQKAYEEKDSQIFPNPMEGLPEYQEYPEDIKAVLALKDLGQDVELTPEQDLVRSAIAMNNGWRRVKRLEAKTKLDKALATRREARAMSRVDGFHYVHTCDFRRRIYARSAALNPQGMGMDKALLCAYEGCRIGEREEWLLKLHIADLAGAKGTKDEMVAWFDANENLVLDAARDPHSPQAFWRWERKGGELVERELKEGLPLLARCFDYADYKADPEGFECKAIIPRDATCSGQQHWALNLRDEELAKSVSLTKSKYKGDLYKENWDGIVNKLEAGVAAGDEEAAWLMHVWKPILDKLGRTFVKKGVMCSNYSQQATGRVRDILYEHVDLSDEEFIERIGPIDVTDRKTKLSRLEVPFETARRAAHALDRYAYKDTIEETSGLAANGKQVLRKVARVMAKHGLTVEWHTPTGAHVQQIYYETSERTRNKFWFSNREVKPTLAITNYDKQRPEKHANSICPQVIHSLDASHAHLIVNTWYATGETFLVTVHDSFGTTLDKVDKLDYILRATMVEMYLQNDPLWDFVNAQVERAKGTKAEAELKALMPTIERLLEKGDYDIAELLESEWCFA